MKRVVKQRHHNLIAMVRLFRHKIEANHSEANWRGVKGLLTRLIFPYHIPFTSQFWTRCFPVSLFS